MVKSVYTVFRRKTPGNRNNKKVLLCERKRHIACCIASARSTALSPDEGVPYPVLMQGGYPIKSQWGSTPIQSQQGVPPSSPNGRYPIQSDWGGGNPSPVSWMGVPPVSYWGYSPDGQMGVPSHWSDGGTSAVS